MTLETIQNEAYPTPCGPENEKFFTARAMSKIAAFFGERGVLAVGTYSYFRWIDDIVDQGLYSDEEKMRFLDRQKDVITGEFNDGLSSKEAEYQDLPWQAIGEKKDELTAHALTLIETITDDLLHSGAKPRTFDEIKKYNTDIFIASIGAINLILNGKSLKVDDKFKEFLNSWYTVGTLKDFQEDLDLFSLKVGFSEEETETINEFPTPEERRMEALRIYDRSHFYTERNNNTSNMMNGAKEFFLQDMPWWQKDLSYLYIYRAGLKSIVTVQYPANEVINRYKHEALMARAKRIISQNYQE